KRHSDLQGKGGNRRLSPGGPADAGAARHSADDHRHPDQSGTGRQGALRWPQPEMGRQRSGRVLGYQYPTAAVTSPPAFSITNSAISSGIALLILVKRGSTVQAVLL